ncbi:MAG: chorismate synthase [Sulfurovaceae bacterium]
MNSFGKRFTLTTFGESHGKAIGCIIDGVPAGLEIDIEFIQNELDRRKPGKSDLETARKESDTVEILSGTFEGKSIGTPIAMVISNTDQKSKDYDAIKDIFRPGHADFTYFHKYGIRDYRGGGRSSARETAARVAAGALAKLMLQKLDIEIAGGVIEVDGIGAKSLDFDFATRGVPAGLGEPLYYKLDGILAEAMMGINAAKAVEIGDGMKASRAKGSTNNDPITKEGFRSNHSGGILGGISNGEEIVVKTYFKPTPSIFQSQDTITKENKESICNLKGRHDPCVAIRGSVVCEAMMALVLVDMLLLNMGKKISDIEKIYKR